MEEATCPVTEDLLSVARSIGRGQAGAQIAPGVHPLLDRFQIEQACRPVWPWKSAFEEIWLCQIELRKRETEPPSGLRGGYIPRIDAMTNGCGVHVRSVLLP